MKLIIPCSIEKQLKKTGITVNDFLCFLKNTPFKSKKLIEICAPLDDIKVYKAYLDKIKRAIIFCKHKKGIVYPVYVGDKNDAIAKNITVNIVRKNVEIWQIKVLKDIQNKQYKIRHY
ncbi:hypothetical protein KAI52_01145 [Candidatus Parcubacteria bacterium]|nr:hypothetical protein [Candidatus Parcubacteria bacterium]